MVNNQYISNKTFKNFSLPPSQPFIHTLGYYGILPEYGILRPFEGKCSATPAMDGPKFSDDLPPPKPPIAIRNWGDEGPKLKRKTPKILTASKLRSTEYHDLS